MVPVENPVRPVIYRQSRLIGNTVRQESLEIARVSKAFANDVLLALSCRESGCVRQNFYCL
jgi:hypothetical protein